MDFDKKARAVWRGAIYQSDPTEIERRIAAALKAAFNDGLEEAATAAVRTDERLLSWKFAAEVRSKKVP